MRNMWPRQEEEPASRLLRISQEPNSSEERGDERNSGGPGYRLRATEALLPPIPYHGEKERQYDIQLRSQMQQVRRTRAQNA